MPEGLTDRLDAPAGLGAEPHQPKAEGIAGTYILYHISRKHLRALSEINFYSETVKFSFFDFCFGFAETGFCLSLLLRCLGRRPKPRRSVAPDSTKAPPWIQGRVFRRDFLRDLREGALPL